MPTQPRNNKATATATATKSGGRKPKPPDQTREITKLAARGLTERQISSLTGVPQSTIHRRLQQIKADPGFLDFADNKADTYEQIQWLLLQQLDQEAAKSMLTRRGLTDVAILEDKIRLIRGQGTAASADQIRNLINILVVDNSQLRPDKAVDNSGSDVSGCNDSGHMLT